MYVTRSNQIDHADESMTPTEVMPLKPFCMKIVTSAHDN